MNVHSKRLVTFLCFVRLFLLVTVFSGRGDFSLGVNMGSDSIPPKTLSDESINRGLVCAHMHSIARTQKILAFMSRTGEYRQQKTHPACTIHEYGM